MANPAKLEINSWIETVRKQLELAENTNRNSASHNNAARGKRNRGSLSPEPSEAQAALIALEDLQHLLTTRLEEVDQLELDFLERSQKLEAAATQLEEQFKAVAANQIASTPPSPSSSCPATNWSVTEGDSSSQSQQPAPDLLTIADQVANQVAIQVTERLSAGFASQWSSQLSAQLSAMFEEKLQRALVDKKCEACNNALDSSATNAELIATHTAELRIELDVSRTLLRENEQLLQQVSDDAEAKVTELRDELAAVYETNAALQAELLVARDVSATESVAEPADVQSGDAALVHELQAEIESLQAILAAVRSEHSRELDEHSTDLIATLNAELADLREQNSDLATQLARIQMSGLHNPPHLNLSNLNQESMTWEQRKRLILQQLENETAAANPEEYQLHRNEVEEILRTTQAEIERRDAEIAELQSIVQQQSNTREGVAIGAAAIAQMLDSDELVKLEREKLAAIQREWEVKLREAEIEMSMERAKLSRERAELEERLRNPVDAIKPASPEPTTNADGKPVRRWLEHLGLRDK